MPTAARIIALEQGSTGVLSIHELDLPDPGPHQVLLQIDAAAVGHQQLHQVVEDQEQPRLMGDEAHGRVLAVGPGVEGFAVGQGAVVTPFPRRDASGRAPVEIVLELDDGSETAPAAVFSWGTNALVDEQYVLPLPKLPDREAATILGATALLAHAAVQHQGRVQAGQAVAVFGVSGTGLAIIAAAKAAGAATIVAVDRKEKRLALAQQLGATSVINATTDAANTQLTEAGLVDVLFDCLYEYPTKKRPGRSAVKEGGVAVLVGIPGSDAEQDAWDAAARQGGYAEAIPAVSDPLTALTSLLEMVAAGTLNPTALVTMRYTIEGVNEATRDLENGDIAGCALIVMEPLR